MSSPIESFIGARGVDFSEGGNGIYDAEIEYLESDGGQYINTEVTGGYETYVKIVASSENTEHNSCLFGARSLSGSSWNRMFAIWQRATFADNSRFDYGKRTLGLNNIWPANDIVTIEKNGIQNLINGQNVGNNRAEIYTCEFPFYLFGCNTAGDADRAGFIGRIYSCTIMEGDEVVRDMIPVRVGVRGYMYDIVTGALFGNSGTGRFILGGDK